MERAECLQIIYPELEDKLVVTIMGACAQELYNLGHRENFFYLQHAMGLASSIGLGLATHLPNERVVVLDGDGSVLMNLGTFATLARYRPRNLIHVIFDTEACCRRAASSRTRSRASPISTRSPAAPASGTSHTR